MIESILIEDDTVGRGCIDKNKSQIAWILTHIEMNQWAGGNQFIGFVSLTWTIDIQARVDIKSGLILCMPQTHDNSLHIQIIEWLNDILFTMLLH